MREEVLKRIFLILFFLVIPLWYVEKTFPSPSNFNFDIQSHYLRLWIDPSRHFIRAEDRLGIRLKEKKIQILSFLIHPKLRIIRVSDLKTAKSLQWTEASFSDNAKRIGVSIKKVGNPLSLSVSYEGVIYDPVIKERALQFVKGDQTTGLIGPEGVYLSSSSHWFPDRPNAMATFMVEATIAEPFRIVTQGELLSEKVGEGFRKSKWIYPLPTESLSLVAGKYSVKTRRVDDIKISTYFFPEDERFSEVFLNAAEEYLKIYSDLLGRYPYKKFDIVQNFFSSGYSFPTFTLLAPEAIRQGREFLRPGALDHEMVHSWWGHNVSAKPQTGNWVEALTTYCTNYYYKELKMGEEIARKHRQDLMQKYAIQVPSLKDYPLRRFQEKREELDGHIGYGKGSMVFHMLRQIVGKDLFFATLRNFSEQYRGKQAGWKDIQRVFEEASGRKLDKFFPQWLDRSGGPQLKLENVRVQVTSKGYLISGDVVQEGEVYQLTLPIEIDDGLGKKSFPLEASRKRNSFSMEVPKIPLNLALDPEGHVFRKLYPEEIIPCLNAFLEDQQKIFVIPDQGQEDEEREKIYLELARMAKGQKGGKILRIGEITEETILNSSLMLFGGSWKHSLFSKLLSNLPAPIRLKDGTFFVNGKRVDEEDESLLLTYPRPLKTGKWVTIFFGSSVIALSRSRYIFFYGWDSYVLFKKGRPVERGSFSPLNSFTSHNFLSKGYFDTIQTQRLKDDVSYLASSELAGRLPGTSGYRKAQTYLIKQLEEMGMTPIIQPFVIRIRDVEKSEVILRTSKREKKVKAVPIRFSKEGEWKGPVRFIDIDQIEGIQSLSGEGAAILLDLPNDLPEEFLFKKVKDIQSRGANVLFIFIKEEALDLLAPYITYPSYFPPKLEERLSRREKEGYSIHRPLEASKFAARAKEPGFSVTSSIFLLPYSQAEEGWVKKLADQKDLFIEIVLRFKNTQLGDSNIGGILYGRDPEGMKKFLVLGAHYDHLGKDEKSGYYYPGADDNASGVAAILEIGRSLTERRRELKRSLVLLFFGGEEWGLQGSRHFVENPFVPLKQVKAMLSVDSIGGLTEEKEVFFVGGSLHPSLTERSRRFVQPLGMKEGGDIDRYAFAFGSDHYPFHQKGIPAIDYFASDYKKLHTHRDNVEWIDFDKLTSVTRLIYMTAYEFLTEPP
mgnify:CR=1 FL=1